MAKVFSCLLVAAALVLSVVAFIGSVISTSNIAAANTAITPEEIDIMIVARLQEIEKRLKIKVPEKYNLRVIEKN